jgi:hypothetical protein
MGGEMREAEKRNGKKTQSCPMADGGLEIN